MLETYLKPKYQLLCVDPLIRQLANYPRCSSNLLTSFAATTGLLAAVAVMLQFNWLAILLLLTSGYLDSLDGSFARFTQTASPRGAVLDIMADRLVEFAIIFGLYLVDPLPRAGLSLLMLGSVLICVTSFLVVGVFSENDGEKSFHYSPGIMERPEAFTFFIAMILLPHWFAPLAWVFSLLVLLTAGIRLWQFVRQ